MNDRDPTGVVPDAGAGWSTCRVCGQPTHDELGCMKPKTEGAPVRDEALATARKALACLRLEVADSIANDIRDKVEDAFRALTSPSPAAGLLLDRQVVAYLLDAAFDEASGEEPDPDEFLPSPLAFKTADRILTSPAAEPVADEEQLAYEILAELRRARAKFPGDNVTTLALMEEVGELAKATFEESRTRVRKEAVQVATMAMRVVLDGDQSLDLWRAGKGLDSLVALPAPPESP